MGGAFLASLLLVFLELRLSSSKKLGGHVCVRLPASSLLHTSDTSTARARELKEKLRPSIDPRNSHKTRPAETHK